MRGGECKAMDCPALLPPAHGYFLRNECKNVFNAACGVRCHSGYQVRKVNILSAHHQVPHLASSLAPALDFVFPPVCGVESHLNARSRLVDRCSRPTMDMFPALLTIMKLTQLASLGRKGTTFCPNTFPGATLVIGCWDQGKDSASRFLFGAASLRTANVRFTPPL